MEPIFSFNDYRKVLQSRFRAMPKQGYGQAGKLAKFMGVHTSLVSQILNGQKDLTADQAAQCADFLGFNDLEADYFLNLVQFARAGTESLRSKIVRSLAQIKKKATDLSETTPYQKALSEEQRAIFYSHWTYSAACQLSAIGKGIDVQSLADTLDIPATAAKRVIDFLVSVNLCKEEKSQVKIGLARTFLERTSPWTRVHHRNWRERAAISVGKERSSDFHYTSPVTLKLEDAERIRILLQDSLRNIDTIIDPSPSEVFRCLCIDWFDPL